MVISKMIGNAVSSDIDKTTKKLQHILTSGEEIKLAFKVVRDMIIITNKRLLFIDYQGLTGKKVEYLTVPYRSIINFSVETSGHLDLDFELKIWVRGADKPIAHELKRNKELASQIIRILTEYTT